MHAEQIEQLLEAADLPSLLAALAHATGDPGLVPTDLWLNPDLALQPDGGWDEQQMEKARVLASSGLQRLMSSRTGADGPADDLVPSLIDWLTGADLDDGYRRMLAEELAVSGDLRVPEPISGDGWPPTDADHPVAVIGAGMSGILAAHRLKQAGVDCVVLEKNRDVGGTWLENTYPGCRVDVFNHVYSYAGEQRPDWPQYHSSQPVLLDYFQDCARRWGIRDRMRFGTGVDAMSWDERARRWTLQLDGGEAITAGAVVSAVGQLNRPLMPDIEGIGSFAGEKFHSSSWRHDIDWDGLRVAVIGTGASALQFIPHLATDAAHVTVFQRTPPWLIPRPVYHEPLAEG
ncbi:MAG: NAD(P)/FAD-dependent oxidoreductase, partial [Acidimicrobiaceae bacterium]|nr:NAD(P)/FAD-dependent oxidoreductase [Acidimicrobiaceae bacterium]